MEPPAYTDTGYYVPDHIDQCLEVLRDINPKFTLRQAYAAAQDYKPSVVERLVAHARDETLVMFNEIHKLLELIKDPFAVKRREAISKFAASGVTASRLANYLGHDPWDMTEHEFDALGPVFAALKEEPDRLDELFPEPGTETV